jgi:hypothetical protein
MQANVARAMVIRNKSIAPTRREKALGIVRSLPNPRIARKLNRGGGDLSTSMRTVRRTDLGPRKGRLWVRYRHSSCHPLTILRPKPPVS